MSSSMPDYIYSDHDPEDTLPFDQRDEFVTEVPIGAVAEFHTLIEGPKKYAANINGTPVWFDDKDEALSAVGASLGMLN